jgi:hypothetical protein
MDMGFGKPPDGHPEVGYSLRTSEDHKEIINFVDMAEFDEKDILPFVLYVKSLPSSNPKENAAHPFRVPRGEPSSTRVYVDRRHKGPDHYCAFV